MRLNVTPIGSGRLSAGQVAKAVVEPPESAIATRLRAFGNNSSDPRAVIR